MTAWDILVRVLSWVGLLIALFLVFAIAWAAMVGVWEGVKKIFLRGRSDLDSYVREARAVADKYRDETAPEFREGFLAGTRWGWGYFHRLRKPKR